MRNTKMAVLAMLNMGARTENLPVIADTVLPNLIEKGLVAESQIYTGEYELTEKGGKIVDEMAKAFELAIKSL